MISIADDVNVMICTKPVDMRKSINGLIILVIEVLKQNPQSNQMYLFYGKSKDKIKALFWHKNGFILLYKKLEKERFVFPQDIHRETIEIDNELLQWLLMGFDFYRLKHHPELKFTQYF